jgi:alpha-L-fucosidase
VLRILDAIEKYDPDLIYTDGNSPEPFSGEKSGSGYKCDAARRVVAHYYNRALARRSPTLDTLALIKFQKGNPAVGMTYENNVPRSILRDQPWIGENPIGDWYHSPGYDYSPINLIRSLLEYASRDGNYACAVPVDPEGGLDPACVAMLADIGVWMRLNGEGIYGSRAWKTWGEGATAAARPLIHTGKLTAATAALPFTPDDLRFTLGRDGSLYLWSMAIPAPGREIRVRALGPASGLLDRPVRSVHLLGVGDVPFRAEADALVLTTPPGADTLRHAAAFRITL